jgi:hypothetical protein
VKGVRLVARRHALDGRLHQVGRDGLVVRPLLVFYLVGDAQRASSFDFNGGVTFCF